MTMRISLQRVGGIAATIRRPATQVDTAALSDEESAALRALVDTAGFFDLPAELPADPAIRDGSGLVMEIEDGPRRRTVSFDLPTAPAGLQQLVAAVRVAAKHAEDRGGQS